MVITLLLSFTVLSQPREAQEKRREKLREKLREIFQDLNNRDYKVRQKAEEKLRAIAGPPLIPTLVTEVERGNYIASSSIIRVIEYVGGEAAVRAFRRLIKSRLYYVAAFSAQALARMGKRDGLVHLTENLAALPYSMQEKISLLSYISYYLSGAEIAKLRSILKDPSPAALQVKVIEVIAYHRDKGSIPILRKCSESSDYEVRLAAMAALARMGEKMDYEPLLKELEEGEVEPKKLSALMKVLSELRDKKLLPRIRKLLSKTGNITLKIQLIRLLGNMGDREAYPLLEALLGDSNQSVAREAFLAIGRLGGERALALYRKILKQKGSPWRLEAAKLLAQYDDPSGFEVALRELKRRDRTTLSRAVEVLRILSDPRAIEPLADLLLDEEMTWRQTALSAIRSILKTNFPYRDIDPSRFGYSLSPKHPPEELGEAVAKFRKAWKRLLKSRKR
jgi:HEAT repeat protein